MFTLPEDEDIMTAKERNIRISLLPLHGDVLIRHHLVTQVNKVQIINNRRLLMRSIYLRDSFFLSISLIASISVVS
jgi:hypothetical protein